MTTAIQSLDAATSVMQVGGVEAFRFTQGGIKGSIVQVAYAEYTANADLSAIIPYDDTVPQSTEGTQILSVTVTPKSTTNKVRLRFQCQFICATTGVNFIVALFSSAGTNAIKSNFSSNSAAGFSSGVVLEHEYVPGVTTPVTFTVRVGPQSVVNVRLNGGGSARLFGGTMSSTLVVEEIAA